MHSQTENGGHASDTARVVVLVEQRLVGETLASALRSSRFDLRVVDMHAGNAVETCRQLQPEVVVVELDALPNAKSPMLAELRKICAGRLVALSRESDETTVSTALERGALGFVSLDASLQEVEVALTTVRAGHTAVYGVPLQRLLREPSNTGAGTRAGNHLTARELAVLARLVRGDSTDAIARELGIASDTARTHIQNLMAKLNVHSRVEAAAYAVRNGLV